MAVLDMMLTTKLELASRLLDDWLGLYGEMDQMERLERSEAFLDEIRAYLQIEENLILPFIQKEGDHQDLIRQIRRLHHEMKDLLVHAIMVHVDEPGSEYYYRMERIRSMLSEIMQANQELVFPWMRAHLTEADQRLIAARLSNPLGYESSGSRKVIL